MKKVLLSVFALATFASAANAQTILSEDFNSYPSGNLSVDVTGTATGPAGWYTENGVVSEYVLDTLDPNYGKSVIIMSGTGGAATDTRFAYKEITVTPSANNNIIKGTFDLFTGTGAGKTIGELAIYNLTSAGMKVITGFGYATDISLAGNLIGKGTFAASGAQPGNYNITLGTTHIAPGTWIKVGFAYNKTTGEVIWRTPLGSISSVTGLPTLTGTPGLVATDIFMILNPEDTNSGQSMLAFDNANIEYSNNTVLNLEEAPVKATGVMVYPNPTTDVLKITAKSKVDAVEIFDLSGKKIEAEVKNNEVDVRSYAPGTYLITVKTKDGNTMTKFIKN